jgi:hypothetical protein
MKPIETKYNGLRFRSRLEARWAVFFDRLNLKYQYEPEAYVIDGINYLPDFYLPELNLFIEIKPIDPPGEELEKIIAFSRHKEILLLVGSPYAKFDRYGRGVRLDYVGEYFVPMPESEKTPDSDDHLIWKSPFVFIQCRDCENIGIESRGYHFQDYLEDDLKNHGGFSGFCCSEKTGWASSEKLIAAYEEARSYIFWQ